MFMLKTLSYICLILAIVCGLWLYADELAAPTAPNVMRPDYPMIFAGVTTDARVAPWSLGDIELSS
jgi:hypothetical protein